MHPRHISARLLPTLLASAFLAMPAVADEAEHWRLFVSDQAEAKVTAIDFATGKVYPPFAIKSYASRLALSESGRTIFAVQSDGDLVNVISTGIGLSDHGEHSDIEIEDPKLIDAAFPGQYPVHAVMHDGKVALFFDNEGEARITSEDAVLKGDTATVSVKATAPHHVLSTDVVQASDTNRYTSTGIRRPTRLALATRFSTLSRR